MNKRNIILYVILILSVNCFSSEWEEFASFEFGNKDNQLGGEELYDTGLAMTISSFDLDSFGNLYIVDKCNKRIVKYDKNGIFQEILLKDMKMIYTTKKIIIENNLMYLISQQHGVLKYNLDTKKIIWEKDENQFIKFKFNWKNILAYNDILIYYPKTNDKRILNIIDNNGDLLKQEELDKYINEINISRDSYSAFNKATSNLFSSNNEFIDENGLLYPNPYSSYGSFVEYAKLLNINMKNTKIANVEIEPFDHGIDGNIVSNIFMGYDKEKLIYFFYSMTQEKKNEGYKKIFVVFTQSGELVTKIQLDPLPIKANMLVNDTMKIDVDGNLYYIWAHTEHGVKIYKYKRNW